MKTIILLFIFIITSTISCRIEGDAENEDFQYFDLIYDLDISFDFTYYIRAGASGDNNGLDWTNAYNNIPSSLIRGAQYYIADGVYSGHTFNDSVEGEKYIKFIKAVQDDHGTNTGWLSSYGDGMASFSSFSFTQPRYYIEGQPEMNFIILGTFESDVIEIAAQNIYIVNCDIDGNFTVNASQYQIDGACTGIRLKSSTDVLISGCEVHNIADDGVCITNSQNILFKDNIIHNLHACGTDIECGPCYNGHSDGIELYNVKKSIFKNNLIYDVVSTSAVFFGNWATSSEEYCGDIIFENNIFYTPETGFVAYFTRASNVILLNNNFWGKRQGSYGGIAIGPYLEDFSMYNNIILSVNYAHLSADYDASEHKGDYNLFGYSTGQYPEQIHDIIVSDPGFTVIPDIDGPQIDNPDASDFNLLTSSPCIDNGFEGDESINIPPRDYYDLDRDSTPDIGAIEYR